MASEFSESSLSGTADPTILPDYSAFARGLLLEVDKSAATAINNAVRSAAKYEDPDEGSGIRRSALALADPNNQTIYYAANDDDGHIWQFNPRQPELGWRLSGEQANPELSAQLSYKWESHIYGQAAKNFKPADPYRQPPGPNDPPTHGARVSNWEFNPNTKHWERTLTTATLSETDLTQTQIASPERAAELNATAAKILANNARHLTIADRYRQHYAAKNWARFGDIPASIKAFTLNPDRQPGPDGKLYARQTNGSWSHDGIGPFNSIATGNLHQTLENTRHILRAQARHHQPPPIQSPTIAQQNLLSSTVARIATENGLTSSDTLRALDTASRYHYSPITGLDEAHTRALVASLSITFSSRVGLSTVDQAGYLGRYAAGPSWLVGAGLIKPDALKQALQAEGIAHGLHAEKQWGLSGGLTRFLNNPANWVEGMSKEKYLASAAIQDKAFHTRSNAIVASLTKQGFIQPGASSRDQIAGMLKLAHLSGENSVAILMKGGLKPDDPRYQFYNHLAHGSRYEKAFAAALQHQTTNKLAPEGSERRAETRIETIYKTMVGKYMVNVEHHLNTELQSLPGQIAARQARIKAASSSPSGTDKLTVEMEYLLKQQELYKDILTSKGLPGMNKVEEIARRLVANDHPDLVKQYRIYVQKQQQQSQHIAPEQPRTQHHAPGRIHRL